MTMLTGNEQVNPQIETHFDFADVYREKVYGNTYSHGGLTIRQHFASIAMQGMNAAMNTGSSEFHPNEETCLYVAQLSVKQADFLIAELNKQQKDQ
jgi:hypothetical protein